MIPQTAKKSSLLPVVVGFCCLLVSCMASANGPVDPPADGSKAGTDGPHVFYRNNKIVVRTVVMDDSTAVSRKSVYRNKKEVLLTCEVPSTGDAFSFGLMDSIVVPADTWPAVSGRILALSDIEGNFEGFKTMLLGAAVMDEHFNWTFGKNHLVLLGDYFDRGENVTECLWLAYKLDAEAKAAGGAVHFILGNHEVMNLANDHRYVRAKYFKNAELIGEKYKDWYGKDTELGRWLRSKNAIEKIGTDLFCHGGLSAEIAATGMDIPSINYKARQWYGEAEILAEDTLATLIFSGQNGVFWYRDMSKNKVAPETVKSTLAHFGGKRVIVGHTLTEEVKTLYDGQVVCIDLFHEDHIRQGFMTTLLIENGHIFTLDSRGERTSVKSLAK